MDKPKEELPTFIEPVYCFFKKKQVTIGVKVSTSSIYQWGRFGLISQWNIGKVDPANKA